MKKYKGLIFDFNGVLLLDQHLHDQIWKEIARKITGRELSKEAFREHLHGRTNKGVFDFLLGKELELDELAKRATQKELAYQHLAKQQGDAYRLAPGAVELLDELKEKHIPFTIGTSSPPMNVTFFDEMLGLHRWFDLKKIACGDETVQGKPAPDIYLKAAELLSLNPEDCVVIEDASSGIEAARAAGIGHIIAIGPEESRARLSELPGVSEIVSSLAEIDVERLF